MKLTALVLAAALCVGCLTDTAVAADSTDESEMEVTAEEIMTLDVAVETEEAESITATDAIGEPAAISPAQPVLKSLKGGNGGVTVNWKAVSGAAKYRVYRKTSGGSWKKLADTKETSYTDASAKTGTTYIYTVRSVDSSGSVSSYDKTGLTIKYVKAPTLTGVSNNSSGVKVAWKKVSGAGSYAVFRKSGSGSWKKIGATTSASYTDKTAASGKKYSYTVRCCNADGTMYTSGYDKKGLSITYLAAPSLTATKASSNGTTVSWKKVSGAKGYAVYRKQSGGSWKRIATTTSTSYKDKNSLSNGKTYYYTVRAYRGKKSTALSHRYNSKYWSGYDSKGLQIVYTKKPTLKSAIRESNDVKVSWGSVSGASGYAVFRKTSGGSWSRIATTTSTSYTDTTAKEGTAYIYTVRAYRGDETTAKANTYDARYWSGYDSSGCAVEGSIVKDGNSYYYIDGTGKKVTSEEIQLAVDFVVENSTEGASRSTRLEESYNALRAQYNYKRISGTPSASDLSSYAKYCFTKKRGNCYRYAAAMTCIAKVLGYETRTAVGQSSGSHGKSPHGWCEVKENGTWYVCDVGFSCFMKLRISINVNCMRIIAIR